MTKTEARLSAVSKKVVIIIADYQTCSDKLAELARARSVPDKDTVAQYTELVERARAAFRIYDIIEKNTAEDAVEALEFYMNNVYAEPNAVPSYTRVVARACLFVTLGGSDELLDKWLD